jgi:hypothetical protein
MGIAINIIRMEIVGFTRSTSQAMPNFWVTAVCQCVSESHVPYVSG